jgi:hypothetical protein
MLFKSVAAFCMILYDYSVLVVKEFVFRNLLLCSITWFVLLAIGPTLGHFCSPVYAGNAAHTFCL